MQHQTRCFFPSAVLLSQEYFRTATACVVAAVVFQRYGNKACGKAQPPVKCSDAIEEQQVAGHTRYSALYTHQAMTDVPLEMTDIFLAQIHERVHKSLRRIHPSPKPKSQHRGCRRDFKLWLSLHLSSGGHQRLPAGSCTC